MSARDGSWTGSSCIHYILDPFGLVGNLDVVADVLRDRSRVEHFLHLAEDLGELEAQLCELCRVGLDHRGVVGPEESPADQFDIDPRRQVLDAGVRCGLWGGSHQCRLEGGNDTYYAYLESDKRISLSGLVEHTEARA